jgi:DNA invertase Pin-like site-specific DNA recombinase
MNAIGYIRVSTDKQDISPEAQRAKIEAMARVHDFTVIDIIEDRESAKSLDRKGMSVLREKVRLRACEAVIIAKLDRLTRSVVDLNLLIAEFERADVALISVAESLDTKSAAGRLVMNIMASVSQWEREAIGERTRDALRHKRAQGQKLGGPRRYGYDCVLRDDGSLYEIENEHEQQAIRRILSRREQGWTLQNIANELNSCGWKTAQGADWTVTQAQRIIQRETNK